jgi:hypothetical protein
MGSLAGYIATIGVGAAGTYIAQFLRPKVKVKYWLSHRFIHTIPNDQLNPAPVPALTPPGLAPANQAAPPTNFFLLTQSVSIQNFGRERADWIEVVHAQKPDFFQLDPALTYTENTAPNGEHTLRVQSLAPKEFFTIQFLCYSHMPTLAYIRSTSGLASPMPWRAVRQYPLWAYAAWWLVSITGAGFCAYWIIKGGIFVLKSVGAL